VVDGRSLPAGNTASSFSCGYGSTTESRVFGTSLGGGGVESAETKALGPGRDQVCSYRCVSRHPIHTLCGSSSGSGQETFQGIVFYVI